MLDKIQEIIRENLPEATAKEMQKFIEQAKEDKENLKLWERKHKDALQVNQELVEKIEARDDVITELTGQISVLNNQIDKCDDCQDKHARIQYIVQTCLDREFNASQRVEDMKEFTALVFRSTKFIREVSGSRDIPFLDQYGAEQRRFSSYHQTETNKEEME